MKNNEEDLVWVDCKKPFKADGKKPFEVGCLVEHIWADQRGILLILDMEWESMHHFWYVCYFSQRHVRTGSAAHWGLRPVGFREIQAQKAS